MYKKKLCSQEHKDSWIWTITGWVVITRGVKGKEDIHMVKLMEQVMKIPRRSLDSGPTCISSEPHGQGRPTSGSSSTHTE